MSVRKLKGGRQGETAYWRILRSSDALQLPARLLDQLGFVLPVNARD